MKSKIWLFIIGLIVLSIATSYVHRYFIGNAKLSPNIPVITDSVIPAIAPENVSVRM